jgi:hypothetical protein
MPSDQHEQYRRSRHLRAPGGGFRQIHLCEAAKSFCLSGGDALCLERDTIFYLPDSNSSFGLPVRHLFLDMVCEESIRRLKELRARENRSTSSQLLQLGFFFSLLFIVQSSLSGYGDVRPMLRQCDLGFAEAGAAQFGD